MNSTKKLVITGLLIAIGITLPLAFHTIPNAGGMFLPMHIPVLLCGLICGSIFGLICGLLTPILSFAITGMPTVVLLPAMVFELVSYGFFAGLFLRLINTKNNVLNIYLTLIPTMIIGRLVSGFFNGVVFMRGEYSALTWATASFVTSLPGILIQIIFIPALIFALLRANILDIDRRDIFGIHTDKFSKRNIEFFNSQADSWDAKSDVSDERVYELLKLAKIEKDDVILDVACGTGIIDKSILQLGAKKVVAIDISDKMIEVARSKNLGENIEFLNANFYSYQGSGFDRVIIFNAYPHFTDRDVFIKKLNAVLKPNGSFAIIHSASPDVINGHHNGRAKKISRALRPAKDEMLRFTKYFNITELIDDGEKYLIFGIKK